MSSHAIDEARAELARQLRASGRASAAVHAALEAVPRHAFLPRTEAVQAYKDMAIVTKLDERGLPVSSSTQPAMMAIMLEQLGLAPGQRVLEIGTGTGYNAAVLATITGDAGSVVTIDIEPDVVEQARASLAAAGFGGVTVVCGDGAEGVAAHAPYDRIIVTAGAWDLSPRWREQLGDGGRIVAPLSVRGIQLSAAFERAGDAWAAASACRCGFIRMTGTAAGPEVIVALGAEPGLGALVTDGAAPDGALLYQALSGPQRRVPAGLRADSVAQLADLDFWLTLTEPGLTRINLISGPESQVSPAQQRIAGLLPFGGFTRDEGAGALAVAAVGLPGDAAGPGQPEVMLTGYGAPGAALATALAERAADWDRQGRPGAGTLTLRAYPAVAGRPGAGSPGTGLPGTGIFGEGLVIERPSTVLVAGWPAA
jgi:protein-L-isoaspartate(D-aspartate) O-methyltransferase